MNLAVFQKSREAREALPADLAALKRPVAGYVGGLHQWVDQDLLAAVAARLPKVNFALVGPEQTDVSRLKALPNVHLFGQRPHARAAALRGGFDVGLVPYRITEYTANVYPDEVERVPGDGHSGGGHRSRGDSPLQRRARRDRAHCRHPRTPTRTR